MFKDLYINFCSKETNKFCKLEEYTNSLEQKPYQTIHPILTSHCTLLSLLNLNQPQWTPISCHDQLINHVVCLSKNGKVTHQKLLDNNITFSCQSTSISYKGRCFCFHQCKSLECSTRNIVSVCKGRNLINVYGNDYVIPTLFRIIWEAVAINDITFAVINKDDKMLQYWNNKKSKRRWLGPISSHNKKDNAHFLCQSKKRRTKPNFEIMCRYTSGVSYVTLQFMCDIKNYCSVFMKKMDQSEFEYSTQKNADFICNSPIFLYKSIGGKFMPYSQQKIKFANIKEHRTVVPFKNNDSFEESTLNDLISDCGYHADDKAIHKTFLMKETLNECS